jgi:DNA-binding NtrC family response regulator
MAIDRYGSERITYKEERSMSPQFNILIVEDDAAVTAALYEVLSYHGYGIITADGVQAAEKVLQCFGVTQVDLVISDIHLTRNPSACEGYGLYQRWASSYPGLPFILMSAFPSSRDLPDIRAQAVRLLQKPFAIEELVQCIEETMGREIICANEFPQLQTL